MVVTPSGQRRAMTTILFIVFLDLFGFSLILPLLPFIAESFGANPAIIGFIVASYSFFQFLSAPVLGALSDRFGRKKLLIVSQLGSAAGFILLGLAHTIPLLFLSRIIDGITGGNISIAQAYMADITSRKNRAKGMGVLGAAFGLGFIFGPAVGGLLSQISFALPAYFAAAMALITVLATQLFLKETVSAPFLKETVTTFPVPKHHRMQWSQLSHIFSHKLIATLIVVFLIVNLSLSVLQGTFALWTEKTFNFGPRQTAWVFTYVGILQIIVQLKVLPFIVSRWGERRLLPASVFIFALSFVALLLSIHPLLLLVSVLLVALGQGISTPIIQALASESVKPEEHGEVLGVVHSAGSLGRVIGPIVGGLLFAGFSKSAPYVTAAILLFVTALFLKIHRPHDS